MIYLRINEFMAKIRLENFNAKCHINIIDYPSLIKELLKCKYSPRGPIYHINQL